MTSPAALPPCPDCRAPLTGEPVCRACGLRLTGREALRLWEVDQALDALDARRTELLTERARLLAALRPGTVLAPAAAEPQPSSSPHGTAPAAADLWSSPNRTVPVPPEPRQEWTPQRVQNSLLGLGALLLTIAGIVFAAVTYDRLGAGGRAAVLVALTLVAGLAVPRLKARGLDATAEAVAVVTLALAALDAYGLRTLGLAEDSAGAVYAAGSAAALAIASGCYAAVVPVRLPRFAAVALAHLPVPLLLAHGHASAGESGLALALVTAADLGAWVLLERLPVSSPRRDVQGSVLVGGSAAAAVALMAGAPGAFLDDETAGVLALLTLAATSACAALLSASRAPRFLLSALPAPLVATAAVAAGYQRLEDVQLPLVLAAVGLAVMQLSALLPRSWRAGPVTGALLTAAAAAATQLEAVTQAVVLPLTWLGDPWSRIGSRDARHALSPTTAWEGTVVTLVVLAAAAVAVAGAGLALHRIRTAVLPTAGLVVAAVVVLPLGLATSYPLALVLLLAGAAALLTAGTMTTRNDLRTGALVAGSALAVVVGSWSTADRAATLLVLPVLMLLFAGVAVRRPEAAAAAALLGGAFLGAGGAARGLATDQVGALLLLAPAGAVGLTFVLGGVRRLALEAATAVLAVAAVVLTVGDVGWLSWALAALGLLALVDALHADRRAVAAAGALLLSASSWVRLADAGVAAPEPYVVPLGLLALALGWLRVRRAPDTRSLPAYGAGLSALLVPSLIASFDDATLARPLLLAAAALVVLLVGAQQRLQAPLVIGGGVLAIDALQLMAPYAAALPRWMTLGAAGLLLVTVGATYEQRRRDVTALRARYDTLA